MNSIGLLCGLGAMACLASGVAWANGTEPASEHVAPPVVMPLPGAVPVPPVWLPAPMPFAPIHPMFPGGGMVWSPMPYYPAVPPAVMAVPPGWFPYVMVLVPAPMPAGIAPEQAAATPLPTAPAAEGAAAVAPTDLSAVPVVPIPAEVDYGPIAPVPVVALTDPDEARAPVEPIRPLPAADYGPVAPTPVVNLAGLEKAFGGQAAGRKPASVEGLSFAPTAIDYGPVAPTPVVSLINPRKQPAAKSAGAKPGPPKAAAKPARATQPVKKRLCWHNGIVGPCD